MNEITLIARQPSWAEGQLTHHWRFYAYKIAATVISLLGGRLFVTTTFETNTGPWIVELSEITDFAAEEVLDQVTGEVKRVFLVVWNGKLIKLPDHPTNESNYYKWSSLPKNKQ
ncbi:hypothetical protein [Burkholderia cenocepacia]|uniref:hypothetical protein n=1 Tax=Burkholderia cenocepacia TaxID=95486 RepID=UPI0011785A7C|nr:hypothetical protein [Burkholderia cenocepacia]